MEYTVKQIANISGVSSKTIRYYDEIGLLKPSKIRTNGYRIYSDKEVDLLLNILFYRELGFELSKIKEIMHAKDFDELFALKAHKNEIENKIKFYKNLLGSLEKTVKSKEKGEIMKNEEKFEVFKDRLIKENEEKYGEEIREKYGSETVEKSNKAWGKMSEKEFEEMQTAEASFKEKLALATQIGDADSQLAQEVFELHKQWLTAAWGGDYNIEAHLGMAQMYLLDERFHAYFEGDVDQIKLLDKILNNFIK